MRTKSKTNRTFAPESEMSLARRIVAHALVLLLFTQAIAPPALARTVAASTSRARASAPAAPTARAARVAAQGGASSPQIVQVSNGYGILLSPLSTAFDGVVGIDYHQPTGKVIVSANSPAGQPNNFELIDADGTHRAFSNISGLAGELKFATARDEGQGLSLGGFKSGEVLTATGAPGVIARVAPDGSTVQSQWVTLPGEAGLPGGLYLDRAGVFAGDLIVVTTAGGVWRVKSTGAATKVADLGTRLSGVVTVPNDADRYGPWAGKILAGAKDQSLIYAVDAQGGVTSYDLGVYPEDVRLIPAHENFYAVDPAEGKIWGAQAAAFTEMAGDVLVAQESPGALSRVHWNGTDFEVSQIATPAQLKQMAFAPAGVAEISAVKQVYDKIAVVRHAPAIDSGRIEGALWQLTGEAVTLDGTDTITSDLLVPGTPTVSVSGSPTYGGTVAGTESTQPTGYAVNITGNATLRHLVTRTNPIQLSPVAAPPAPSGARDVSLTQAGQPVGDFSTLRHLTLSGKAGAVSVPPGTYGRFAASSHTAFVLGVAGAQQPSVYNLESLSLSGGSELRVAGPVVLTVSNGVTLTGSTVGSGNDPRQLVLQVSGSGVGVGGGSVLYAVVRAPQSTVTVDGKGRVRGTVSCDRLTVAGGGVLQVTEGDLPPPPVNRFPTVSAGPDQTITLPTDTVSLSGSASDDGLPAGSTLSAAWSKVSGPGQVTFANASSPATTATFSTDGTYVLRLSANDTLLTSSDDVTVTVIPRNQPPVVSAGPDQTIELPDGATLSGTVSDDALPRGSVTTVVWSKVSGPGTVTFADAAAAATTATFSAAGTYVLRLTASDTQLTATDDAVVTVYPQNQPPTANAGPDQTVSITNGATLAGVVADDGLPRGSTLTSVWSLVSGPSDATFADAAQPSTTVSFGAPGTYTLRLTASDTRLTASDDVVITVLPVNQPPTANAGPDVSALVGENLLRNAGGESALVEGSIPFWTMADTGTWTRGAPNANGLPFSLEGDAYFYPTALQSTELRQDVDVSAFAPLVAAGAQSFEFKGYVRAGVASDGSRIIVEYRDGAGQVISSFDSGVITSATGWSLVSDTRVAPAGTRNVRVRLVSSETGAQAGGGLFDGLSLRALGTAATTLAGSVTDDGLPTGGTLSAAWSEVSGPAQVTFSDAHAAATTATFTAAGTYVLRLTANDSQLNNSDDVTITVAPANLPPTVSAGADLSAVVSRPVNLSGAVSDDGLPAGGSLVATWAAISGPGGVTFGDAHQAATTATFDQPGVYTLRLTASDTEYSISDEVVVTVEPANQAPVVNAGPDQSVNLPASANLAGSVSDDGRPAGATLTITWSKTSGPGEVTFGDAHAPATTAAFSAPGTYVLKLSASDTELTGEDDVTVNVASAANQPPTVSAGADQSLTLPTNTVNLNGSASDDGLPLGGRLSTRWSVVSARPAVPPDFFGDDFDDNSFDTTKWQNFQIDTFGAQLIERNERLEFQTGPQGGGGFFRSNGYIDAREHTVTFKFGGYNPSSGQSFRFRVRDDAAATTYWMDIGFGSMNFYADSFFDFVSRGDANNIPYDGTNPVWVRWRESGQLYSWDTSTDGVNWTPRVETTFYRPVTTAQYFRFDYGSQPGGPVIYIDDFAMISPAWAAVAGPGTVTFADPNSPATTATFSDAGIYTLRLTASDTQLERTSDVTVKVAPANHPPVVNAGEGQTVLIGDGAKLYGVVSDEGLPAGAPVTAAWSEVSGPGTVTFADANSPVTTAAFSTVGYYVLRLTASDTQLSGSADLLVKVVATYEGQPGGVFITGHDADDHSQGLYQPALGAQHVVQRAIRYVTYNKTSPKILLVTDLRDPGGDNSDPRNGMRVSGYNTFDVADYGSGTPGVFDLHTVNFSNYDVVVVASDFGCWLRQDELDILNARSAELLDYVNQGGGLVAFAESGGRPVPPGNYTGTAHDRFRFVPFVVSSEDFQQAETGTRVTPDGAALGLADADVNGNFSHNIFTTAGGMTVIDRDSQNQMMSLAVRGRHITPEGIGNDAPVVSAGAARAVTLPNGVALSGVASDDGLPAGSTLTTLWRKISGPGAVTFDHPDQVNTQAFFDAPGIYVLRLSASDGQLSSYADVTVTVNPAGQYVVVNAGADQTVRLPKQASLQATVTDGRPNTSVPLTLAWSKASGPGDVAFASPNALATNATFSAPGVYVLRFTASDSQYSGSDDLTVDVRPQAQIFGDDFDDNTNDPTKWAYGPGVGERNQQLQIDVPDSASLAGFVSTAPVDMSADGAYVQFEIPDYASPSFSDSRIIYWRMQVSEGNWFQWVYRAGSLEFYQNNQFLYRNPYGLHPRFWRMIHHAAPADYVSYDTSDDGVSWNNWVGASQIPLDHLTFRLIVGSEGPGAAGTVKIDNVTSNVPYNAANQPPTPVTGGPYRATVGVALQLDGSRSTDPGDIITSYSWDFGDGTTGTGPTPTHTYNSVGTYTVRLTVADPDGATGSTTTTATVTPPNQPPTVSAGADQTITLPSKASLGGSVSDDGLPAGGALSTQWSVVSGPGAVAFADASSPATTASFVAAGVYVLRLSASDSELTSTADVTVTVGAAAQNQAPVVNAGSDQTVTPGLNLVRNGGGEETVVAGAIPGWTKVEGDSWSQASVGATPEALEGETYFQAGGDAKAELRQDVDVSAYAASISTGAQQFAFRSAVRSGVEPQPDSCRVVFEFRDATNANVLATVDSGEIANTDTWQLVEGTFAAPVGTSFVRVRLIATRNSGTTTDAYFDSISVRAVSTVGVKLNGTVTDDGLPAGASTTATWSVVSGPGTVAFAGAHSAATSATFDAPGAYVLRLAATDTELTTTDDVTINVTAPNNAPNVVAGAAQTITLPDDTLALAGVITDDGLPQGSSVSARWKKVAGPGAVTFADANSASTSATFAEAGNYILRLTADDSDMSASSDLVVTVKAAPANQPPVVVAGPNQSISLPDAATLRGSATDDGLPAGSSLTYAWSEVSGPGAVTFSAPASPTTNASFAVEGVYVLRLTASDSQLTAHADVTVTVQAAGTNNAPVVSAGPDIEVRLPDSATLYGNATDDGKPAGGALTVAWGEVSGPGAVTFANPASAQTQAAFASAGTYVLRLTASDTSLTSSDDVTVTVFDPVSGPAPTVSIASPADGEEVTAPKQVVGTVSGGAWRLEYALVEDETAPVQQWHAFASGSGAVTNGSLGTFDPTVLLNGTYSLRLVATDAAGQTSVATVVVVVARQMKVGNFTVSFNDLSVPVAGIPIQVTRTYDSRDKRTGDFGVGWTLSVSSARVQKTVPVGSNWYETESFASIRTYCLQSTRPQLVTVTFGDGKVYKFQAVPAQQCQRFEPFSTVQMTFVPVQGTRGSLAALNGGAVSVAGSVPGPVDLVDINDPSGYYLNPTRFRLTTEDGTSFVLDQKSGVESISVPSGETLAIDPSGIHHSGGQSVTFARDTQGRISGITDPSGHTLTYTYDSNGDLQSFRDAEGNTTAFTYSGDHMLAGMEVRSADGTSVFHPVDNSYVDGRLVKQLDADGHEIKYEHDLADRREVVTDRLGNPTTYEYDERGNVVYVKDAEGGETRRSYDAQDNMLTETTAEGTTTNVYDAANNLTQTTDPYGNVTKYTYNALKRVTSVTDPLGRVTTSTYDEQSGNLLKTVDAEGNETDYAYKLLSSRRISMTVIAKEDPSHPRVTQYGYDRLGRLSSTTDPSGSTTAYTYDANNNRQSQTVTRTKSDGTQEQLTTSFEYDSNNRLTKTTYPDATFTSITYNEIGQRIGTKDQLGHETKYEYDEMGQLIKTTYPDGNKDESKYDAGGHRTQSVDRDGRTTNYTFDKVGRLTETLFADGGKTTTLYDSLGRVLEVSRWLDATHKNTTTYRYDAEGHNRVVYITDALGHVTKQTYDEAGNLSKVTDANNHTTTYEYDRMNRRVKTTYHDGTFDKTSYDGFGQVSSKTDQAGKLTQFRYDQLGRLVKVIDALGLETNYTYDELGHETAQTDANNHVTSFEYDSLGRRTKRTLPEGMSEVFAYDAIGNLRSRTDFNGKTTVYEYDSLNRQTKKTPDQSLGEPPVTFAYTPTGKRETMTDGTGLTAYTYDSRDRLLVKQTPEGTLTYTYDTLGNLRTVRSSNANGVSVDYGYDALSRLGTVRDNRLAENNTTTYAYDNAGNVESCAYGNGVKSLYTYDALNRLTAVTASTASSTIATYTYVLGAAGNRLSVAEQGGRSVSYGYDGLYRLTGETVSGDANPVGNGAVHYGYDNVGNRLSRASTLAGIASSTSTFDKNDRLAGDTYDADGNTKAADGRTFAYDSEDRLVSADGGSIRYAYDGDGNRVSKTVGGVTTVYLVDTNNPTGYTQVAEELQGGQVTRSYAYGRRLISERQLTLGSWVVSYYGLDGQGGVRYLTDSAGAVTDAYSYDSFGNLISVAGGTPNEYLYAGERLDGETGLYHLRARQMSPQRGRFLTSDPYLGERRHPATLHRYAYAANDPVNKIDPAGRMAEEEVEAAGIEAEMNVQEVELAQPVEETAVETSEEVYELDVSEENVILDDIESEASDATTEVETDEDTADRALNFTSKQLQKKFKHASDFGIEGNYNSASATQFQEAIEEHVADPTTKVIQGTYRGNPVTHYVNPNTGLNVMKDSSGEFLSGWRLNPDQLMNVLTRGSL